MSSRGDDELSNGKNPRLIAFEIWSQGKKDRQFLLDPAQLSGSPDHFESGNAYLWIGFKLFLGEKTDCSLFFLRKDSDYRMGLI